LPGDRHRLVGSGGVDHHDADRRLLGRAERADVLWRGVMVIF